MKILFQIFSRLGLAAIMIGLVSFVLPIFGLRFRNAGYLDRSGAKLNTILFGLALLGLAFLVSIIDDRRKKNELVLGNNSTRWCGFVTWAYN